jgi:hypothetical protein
LALIAAAFMCSCSGGNETGSTPAPVPPAADTSSFAATWKPETLVLDRETVQAKLRNRDAADGVYQFDPSLTEVAALNPGQLVLLTGVGLLQVDAVDARPDATVVTTEPGSLLDAASDADIAWDTAADFSQSFETFQAAGLRRPQAAPVVQCDPASDGGPCVPKTKFSGKLGNLDASQSLVVNPDGSLLLTLSIKYPQMGSTVMSVAATAKVGSFRHQGSIVVRNGVPQTEFKLSNLDLDLDLNVGAVALGAGDDTFKYPIDLTFPFELGPLPAYFKIGCAIELNPSLSDSSSARSHAHYHFVGSFGFTFDGTTVTSTGSFEPIDGSTPSVKETETVSTVTGGFGVLLEFPKVTFGTGVAKVATAEVYLVGKEEVVINQAVNIGQLGLIVGSCTTVSANVGAYAGGKLSLLKLGFSQEKQLYGKTREVYKSGNPSMAECH